ncbi:GNAT family N-acetyltransferase [Poseidonibacter ostreae]|uniref:GNAT family N-acetyltransferase n=1 Tax=Poseidonibacter ostreae TaxID=2654171 RepID=A0A6L4WVD9_9BACT|nr:GNAT family N-acetyltransferase [Poseidonibacter ostreae]KAB7887268.1 GNAT family N-acetyltransferase [Poseidonibacter ostreae]KAB7890499.1 GNAT family N-acetyltransferase [Poseidonibacter ostreae]KAB7890908.1 GNAT family N-acetyltransferase [Poseidonibacter ostreae]MAC84011.1 GNAT family N-acetyltransferase [Arcobacter sp.]
MKIKIATEDELKYCYKIMHQVREDLSEKDLSKIISEQIKNGYKLAYVLQDEQVICVAGFSILQKLSLGKHLYIDDFVTDKSVKSTDAGKALLDFLKIYAKQQDCRSIELDSLVQRYDAHKFYLSEDMQIVSHHFSFEL